MGCASSSPLIGGPGGIVETAKKSGENVLHEVEHTIQEKMGHVKGVMEDAVHTVSNGIDEVIMGKKEVAKELQSGVDEMQNEAHKMTENFENMKNDMKKRVEDTMDETEKMANDLMKDTEDVVRDAETGIIDEVMMLNGGDETTDTTPDGGHIDILDLENKTPTHSMDSLKTGSPEPEIERLLDEAPSKTPEATLIELEQMAADETQTALDAAIAPEHKEKVKSIIFLITDQMKYANFDFSADTVEPPTPEKVKKTVKFEEKPKLVRCDPTDWELLADEISRTPLHQPKPTKSTSIDSNYFSQFEQRQAIDLNDGDWKPLNFHYKKNGETQMYDDRFANLNGKLSPTNWEILADELYQKATQPKPRCVTSSTSIESIFIE